MEIFKSPCLLCKLIIMKAENATYQQIEVIVRAVVLHNDKILLCREKNKNNYFFPGGHVEFKEDAATALKREIKEETDADMVKADFIGVLENRFWQEGTEKHEINIVFYIQLASPDIKDMEDHIECRWLPLGELKQGSVLPVLLKEKVLQWIESKQTFFGSEKDDMRIV